MLPNIPGGPPGSGPEIWPNYFGDVGYRVVGNPCTREPRRSLVNPGRQRRRWECREAQTRGETNRQHPEAPPQQPRTLTVAHPAAGGQFGDTAAGTRCVSGAQARCSVPVRPAQAVTATSTRRLRGSGWVTVFVGYHCPLSGCRHCGRGLLTTTLSNRGYLARAVPTAARGV